MKRILHLLLVAVVVAITAWTTDAFAGHRRRAEIHANAQAARMAWHGEYQHTASGYAVPLVVPPTANASTDWSWGVAQTTVRPIYHQFRRPYVGDGGGGDGYDGLRPTPPWPSHTRQFGVYPVRSPW